MTAKQIIETALEAFSNNGTDDEIVEAMTAVGVDSELAVEALLFVPLAFSRVAFASAGPEFPGKYQVGDAEHALADHPLYLEALAAAGRCQRETFRAVVLRSSETNALNSAAHAGSKLEDLVVSPPMLPIDPARGRAELESTARVLLAPESRHAAAMSRQAFVEHGATGGEIDARVYSGSVRPGFVTLQLDLEVHHPNLGDRHILESAGGAGASTRAAIGNAFEKLCRGSLHPILGGVFEPSLAGDWVEIDERPGWRLTCGPQLHQMQVPESFDYGPLFDALIDRFIASDPTREIHWLRIFYMQGPDGPYGHDVLVDNQVWADGVDLVTTWPWPREGTTYAIRHFVVASPRP